jgi:ADP-heptose:LPS heptosyltransferase
MMHMAFKRIGILHLNQIGDLLFALPLLKALRQHAPGAVIDSYVKPYLRELLDASSLVDTIIDRRGGLLDTLGLIRRVRRARYDLLITLSRSEECLLIAALSGAACRAGFSHVPLDRFLHVRETIKGHNSWSNNARLLKRFGVPVPEGGYVGLLPCEPYTGPGQMPEKYVVLSAGASSRRQTKAWEPDKFAAVADELLDRHSLSPVLVGGEDCRSFNDETLSAMQPRARAACVDLTGAVGLRQLSALLAGACLFVGIDSGVMHIASAHDVPLVALFGPSDPAFVAPHNRRSRIVRNDSLDCIPCYLKPCDHCTCMRSISADQVMEACESLLEEQAGRVSDAVHLDPEETPV